MQIYNAQNWQQWDICQEMYFPYVLTIYSVGYTWRDYSMLHSITTGSSLRLRQVGALCYDCAENINIAKIVKILSMYLGLAQCYVYGKGSLF